MAAYNDKLKALYGKSESAVRDRLTSVALDWPAAKGKVQSRSIKVNKIVMAARLRLAVKYAKEYCAAHPGVGYTLKEVWCFNWRVMRGGTSLSMHSGAIAIDINPGQNPMGAKLITDIPAWLVDCFKRAGFDWGGSWSGTKDAMHFELRVHSEPTAAKPSTPAPSATYVLAKVLKKGIGTKDKPDAAVKKLQAALKLTPTGIFDATCEKAVKAYQAAKKLTSDGIVGKGTAAALGWKWGGK